MSPPGRSRGTSGTPLGRGERPATLNPSHQPVQRRDVLARPRNELSPDQQRTIFRQIPILERGFIVFQAAFFPFLEGLEGRLIAEDLGSAFNKPGERPPGAGTLVGLAAMFVDMLANDVGGLAVIAMNPPQLLR